MPGSTLKLFTLLLALGAAESLKSQIAPPAFEHISLEHGLSQATVYAILQDTRGYMWFGTQDRLNRFDGYSFVIYRHSQTDSNSLPDNWIWCLYEDRFTPGVLWIGTQNGLSRFDGVTNRFSTYKHDPEDGNSLSHNYIKVIYQDRAGRLWIGTEGGGLNRLDFETGHVTPYQHDSKNPRGLSHNRVTSIFEDDDGRLWIGTLGSGLDCLDPRTGNFTHCQADPKNAGSISSNHVMCLYADPAQKEVLWIGTYGGGLNRFDLKSKTFSRFEYDPNNPNTLSDIVWSFDARNDTVGDLLDRMREFAASVLSARSIVFSFNVAGLELPQKLPVDIRQSIYLIFKEAINNIAKHAEASRVDIQLKNGEGAFSMTIRDDGNAPCDGEKLTGHGLRNMKMRASRLGGHLEIMKDSGYTVSLTAPALR